MVEQLNPEILIKKLDLERFGAPEHIEWLDQSCDKDSGFWSSLCSYHDSLFGGQGKKSRAFKLYDLFHDLITRNLNRQTPAFIFYDPVHLWQKISYEDLGKKAELISAHWKNCGLMPGQTLCIIKPFGLEYLVSFLAGLRMGLILSFVMPKGKALIARQLTSLKPDYICTQNIYLPLLQGFQDLVISENGPGETTHKVVPSHTYAAGETAARLFDPMCQDPFTPRDVASDFLYLSGIRDGLLGLRLNPGDIFTAPGFNDVLSQPSFLLSVLLNGASYLHLTLKDIEKDPDLLTLYPLKVLGITPQLRDILITRPARKVKLWYSWFRDPSDASDMPAWDNFINKLDLTDIPAGCMVWNAAMGGCILFSRRRKGQALQTVLPLPGRKWQLSMMDDVNAKALAGLGLFCVNADPAGDEESYLPTTCILMETYLEKTFVGLNMPARKGMFYPKEFMREIVYKMDSGLDPVIVEIPNSDKNAGSKFHLLIFAGITKSIDGAALISDINRTIKEETGGSFFVDDIKIFPLFPRRTEDNRIDEDWCCLQYLNGSLHHKSRDDIYIGLAGIRAHCLR